MSAADILESSLGDSLLGASDGDVDPFDPIVNWRLFVVPILAFFCEFIDSSLGMGYGTTLTPVLLTPNFAYERSTIVQSVLISELATGLLATFCHTLMSNLSLGCDTEKCLPDCLRTKVRNEEEADQQEQAEIAELMGVKQPVYQRFEKGTFECNYIQLVKLADIYDVSIDYLLGRTEY